MRKIKRYVALSLVACMTLIPLGVMAEDVEENITMSEEAMEEKSHLEYSGKVIDIMSEEVEGEIKRSIYVRAEEEENPQAGIILHLSDKVIILNDSTKDFVSMDSFEVGMDVTTFYHRDTPMMMSMPGQVTPDVLVVNESDEVGNVYVSSFNEDLVSADNSLKLNLSQDTIMVDESGNTLEIEDVQDEDLIVFYTASTKSIPAQTTPEKVILMDKKEAEEVEDVEEEEMEEVDEDIEIEVDVEIVEIDNMLEEDSTGEETLVKIADKIYINTRELKLDHPVYQARQAEMFPLRQVAERLGYKVTWSNKDQAIQLVKGAEKISLNIGKDRYILDKNIINLGVEPKIIESSTYVPMNFIEEILRAEVETNEFGMIEIMQ